MFGISDNINIYPLNNGIFSFSHERDITHQVYIHVFIYYLLNYGESLILLPLFSKLFKILVHKSSIQR